MKNKRFLNRLKVILVLSFYFGIAILYSSCKNKYNPLNDKTIIPNIKLLDNQWKFILTIYYNPVTYLDRPLELGEIRDGRFEIKKEYVFYERSFPRFLSSVFSEAPVLLTKQKIEQDRYSNFIFTLCEIRNEEGKLLLWYTYDDNSTEPNMLLNGNVIVKNRKLCNFTKSILQNACGPE